MPKQQIFLGFEIGTGKKVNIELSHLIATGVTRLSGKTTALEAIIKRSDSKAIIFRTKRGEQAINEGTIIPPYYKERFDWEEAAAILEASRKEKLKFERSWIIRYSRGANSLLDFKKNIDQALEGKLRELDRSVLITLQAYLNKVLPELQYGNFSRTLEMREGINIIDLERYSEETQGLIISSVLDTVLNEFHNCLVVMPEAWKYLSQDYSNPCKRHAEAFIRQGATNNNFLLLDAQDLRGIDKMILRQVSVWIMGLQTQINEVESFIKQIPLPKSQKPKPEEIMTLELGHFLLCSPKQTKKIYVCPAWLDEQIAKEISLGTKSVDEISKPTTIVPFTILPALQQPIHQNFESQKIYAKTQQDLIEIRQDFFTKLQNLEQTVMKIGEQLIIMQSAQTNINDNEIVSKVLQKIPTLNINKAEIIAEIAAKIPHATGSVVYEVAPLEKIRKDFLDEAKNKIVSDIQGLNDDEKKILKYIETKNIDITPSEIMLKCLMVKVGGSQATKTSNLLRALLNAEVIEKTSAGRYRKYLKKRLQLLMGNHSATEDEIENTYNHIVASMI